ncbi:MAG: autotransporter-associated beta strand repeat-containing protein, partial [Planctomycetaceae bacterium]|nr:autotransporter-associated beta strand repeat-containing protein [Planctomycetaceae bacterium]
STFNLNGFNQQVAAVSTMAGATVTGAGSTLTLGGAANTLTATGVNRISARLQLNTTTTLARTISPTNAVNSLTIDGDITEGTAAGALTKAGLGTLYLSGNNNYTGLTTVSAGVLNISSPTALGDVAGATTITAGATLQIQGNITTAAEGLTIAGGGAAGQSGALVNVGGVNNFAGLITLGAAPTISSDAGVLNLTNAGNITGSGAALTLAGAGDGTIAGAIATAGGTLRKNGAGKWTLKGANTYTGTTTIAGGALQIGDGTTGSLNGTTGTALAFLTTGRIIFNEAAGSAQNMSTLDVFAGEATVESVYGGSATTSLTAAGVTRLAGGAMNFVTTGGTNGVSNQINLSGKLLGFIDQGYFYNGGDYVYLNADSGFVRAPVYDVDPGFTNAGAALIAGAHNRVAASISNQTAVSVNTIKFDGTGAVDLALTGALTLTNGGLLRSGGTIGSPGTTTIAGGSITGANNADFVFRAAGASDTLTINSPILAAGTNTLTKAGIGLLVLSGTNTYTGATYIDAGTLRIGNASALGAGAVTINETATLDLNGQAIGNAVSLRGTGSGGAALTNSSVTAAQVGALTLLGDASIGGSGDIAAGAVTGDLSLVKVGTGTLTFTAASNRLGSSTNRLDAGVLRLQNAAAVNPIGVGAIILNGGTLSLGFDAPNATISGPQFVTADSTIVVDRLNSGVGVAHSLGNSLVISGQTLTLKGGSNIASGTAGLTIGSAGVTLLGSPTFDVQSPAGGITSLSMGALNDSGVARTITFTNTGTVAANSSVVLTGAATSLTDGTVVNVTGGAGGVNLALNAAGALGSLAQVNLASGGTLTLG